MARDKTPMMRQYLAIKAQHPDALLLYRMGDFYEMFFEDAVIGARDMELTLTSRDKGSEDPIPLCGIPHHALKRYLRKLLDRGHKVAICDQVEDPKKAKGIVKREVTRVVTPGTNIEDDPDDERIDHFLLAVAAGKQSLGLAALDLGTGEFRATELSDAEALADEAAKLAPQEILLAADAEQEPRLGPLLERLGGVPLSRLEELPTADRAAARLKERFGVADLSGFGLERLDAATRAAAAALEYAEANQQGGAAHIDRIAVYAPSLHLVLDQTTVMNLEIVESLHDRTRKGSLLGLLDRTRTPLGGRRLRAWLLFPLRDRQRIESRLQAVAALLEEGSTRARVREGLGSVRDLERLNGRVQLGRANARDLNALASSLGALPVIREDLAPAAARAALLVSLSDELDPCADLVATITSALADDPPVTLTEGGLFREGFDERLDELIDVMEHGKDRILEIEKRERERTGIGSLKVRYNKVFGYFIEVTKANLDAVPEEYIRKQTLVNAERFITPELKEHEEKVLSAEERRAGLERDLFDELLALVAVAGERIRRSAMALGRVDALAALAEVAAAQDYCRPVVGEGAELKLVDSRHPVVEVAMPDGERFVPNDVDIDGKDVKILIVTGPNMAGKSTVMRQVALNCLMAQAGSFVPAREARLPVIDRIFTRVGASDELARGRSTFMVEMSETANILHNATADSLVILDEIGRGTSTFDGLSIAWSVAEHLHDRIGCKTLFATHYHELTELARTKQHLANVNIAVKEWNERVVFLRKLVSGGTNRSYGIQVARLAGLPPEVIARAREILANIETGELDELGLPAFARTRSPAPERGTPAPPGQLSLFGVSRPEPSEVERELSTVELETLSPLEALNLLHSLKAKLEGE